MRKEKRAKPMIDNLEVIKLKEDGHACNVCLQPCGYELSVGCNNQTMPTRLCRKCLCALYMKILKHLQER